MDTRDHTQLILCHVQNITRFNAQISLYALKRQPDKVAHIIPTIIANAQCIDQLASELFGEQTKRKELNQCSLSPEK